MVDSTLAQVGRNLSDVMRILGDGQREPETGPEKWSLSRTSIPGPLQGVGQDVGSILLLVHNMIHDAEEGEEPEQQRMHPVGEQAQVAQVALLGHSLAAYLSLLQRGRLRRLSTRVLSDTTLWLCRLFRYESGSAYFHEDERDGVVKVCRLVINARYEDYAAEGYAALGSRQPVVYLSASGRPGLGQHLCSQLGLPLSSLCTVPCNTVFGSQHQMDVALLDKLIKEDVEAGKLPLLLVANAGTPGAGHTDKLARLKDLCDQHSMWLHVEGVNLATLALAQVSSSILAASRSDSMTLTPGQWLGLPAVTAVTLYRHEDPALSLAAGLTLTHPVSKLRSLPLWLSLQSLGQSGIVERIRHATALSEQLLQKLRGLASIKTSVEEEVGSPVVLFRFCQDTSSASSGGSVEALGAGDQEVLDSFNRWLGERLLQLVPTSGLDVVELEDEGACVRFSPLLTAAGLGTQQGAVEELVEQLSGLLPALRCTLSLRPAFREEARRHAPSLRHVEELGWPGLGAVRYEPQAPGGDQSRSKEERHKINAELLRRLQELDTDILFSSGPDSGLQEDCVFVGMVQEDLDVPELLDTVATLGRDIEESGRLLENMAEVVRRGIMEAELQLQRANEEKLLEEGMLRQLPLVGSVMNWFSPSQSSIKGRSFNLAAGSLDSTENKYSTKTQPGRPALQESPTSSSRRHPGHRLFQRSGPDSIGPAEETTKEETTKEETTKEETTKEETTGEETTREETTGEETTREETTGEETTREETTGEETTREETTPHEEDLHPAGVEEPENLQESPVQQEGQEEEEEEEKQEEEEEEEERHPEGHEEEQS